MPDVAPAGHSSPAGNLILLIMNLPLIQVWVQRLEAPRPLLYAGILAFACFGVYSLSASG